MFRLTIKMIKKDWKASFLYLVVMVLTIAIHFTFTCSSTVNLLSTEGIDMGILGSSENLVMTASTAQANDYLNGVIVIFCCFLMFYMNKNFIYNKKKEIAILKVSGASTFQIISYLTFLLNLSFILGIVSGYVGVSFLFQFVANLTNTAPPTIDTQNLAQACILIVVVFVYLIFYIISYVLHVDVKELLASRNNVKVVNEPPVRRYPDIVYLEFYVGSVVLMLLPILSYDKTSVLLFFSFLGIHGLINGYINREIFKLKKDKLFLDRYLLISTSNFSSTLLTNKITILSMIYSIIMMFLIVLKCSNNVSSFILSLAGYGIAIILLSFTITFDLMTQAKQRAVYYVNLWKIGYTRKELIKIMRQEIVMVYSVIIVLTLLVIGIMGFRYVQAGAFNATIYLYMLGFYIAFVLFTSLITYLVYRGTIRKAIVEEK